MLKGRDWLDNIYKMRVQFYRDRLWGQLIPFRHINGHVYEKVEQINGQRH